MTPQDVRDLTDKVHDVLSMAELPPAGNGGAGTASASRPPMPTAVLDAKIDLKQKLASWAMLISEEGEYVLDADDDSMSIAAWIHTKADWLAAHPAADAEFIAAARTEWPRMAAALQRVADLHQPDEGWDDYCSHCSDFEPGGEWVSLPCPTLEAIEGDE